MSLVTQLQRLSPNILYTLAGVGYRTAIPACEADAGWPMGVVRRPDGDLIVVDYHAHRLWRIDGDGILHAFAGDGIPGDSGDGGPASAARFYWPHDLTQDREGNLYLSDLGNQTIRRIDYRSGIITRVAGSGRVGRGGNGGPALMAELDTTCGVAVDRAGNLYLSSEWANNVRRVDGRTGIITLFAGQNAQPNLHGGPQRGPGLSLMGYAGDGGPAGAAAFHHPEHLAFDSHGDLYICDNSNDRIRKIDMHTGLITTVFGTGQRASNGDGEPAIEASTLMPDAICLDAHDNLYVGEKYGYRVRKVEAATGLVRTLVGNGVPGFGEEGLPGDQTHCNSVEAGIWADPDGTVFYSDCSGRLRRYDGTTGIVTTVLGGLSVHDGEPATHGFLCGPGGLAVGPDGTIFIADVWSQRIRAIDPATGLIRTVAGNGARAYGGDTGPAVDAYLGNPHDVAVDSQGRVLIADTRNGRIRRVEHDGTIRTLAGTTLPWDAGEGRWDKGDHGPAVSASFSHIEAVAVDAADNIYIGDGVGRIRKIDAATGIITTVAGVGISGYRGDGGPATQARIGAPTAIRFDRSGNLYFTDRAYHIIRKVDGQGIITTVAGCGEAGFSPDGTAATLARLNQPWGVAIDQTGMVYFADSRNNCVRRITAASVLETVAGSTTAGDSGDGVPATQALLNEPHGLCLYGENLLLISDHYNNRVRVVRL
jgi:sugar lactone lactonase YvrE